jgi:regulator of protease activity HflC (stomatin/prohibitin superfamily)
MSLREKLKRKYEENRVRVWITAFVIVFLLAYLAPRIVIFVDPGRAGVLFHRFGGGLQTYREGTHLILPYNTMTIYDLRISQTQSRFTILTKDGVSVGVDASIQDHPDFAELANLHKQIGPEYVQKIVLPEIQATIREVFGRYTPEQIYQSQDDLLRNARNDAALRLRKRFIILDNLLIKSIELPTTIQNAIQSKLVAQQASEEMRYRIEREEKERERKGIEGQGVKLFNDTVRSSLSDDILRYKSIEAFLELAKYGNSNTIVFGAPGFLPLVMPPSQPGTKTTPNP